MKILHVNRYLTGGGVEQYLAQLFDELTKRGFLNIFLYDGNGEKATASPNVTSLGIKGIAEFHCKDLNAKLKAVQEFIQQETPDLVYIHQVSNSSLIDLLTTQRPSIRFVHDLKLVCPDGTKMLKTVGSICTYPLGYSCQARSYRYRCMPRNPFIGVPLIRHSRKTAQLHRQRSRIVVASRFMKSVLIRNGFEENKVEVIPYFTNLPEPKGEETCSSEPIILSLGRIIHEKGMHYLLRALPAIQKKPRLIIVGDGPALVELKSLVSQLGISSRVSFPGWLSHEKLDQFYRQCSLVVVPSIWPEPFGIVGIEAMAHQKPVVAFDVGGISQWLKEGETGFLVNRDDEADLVQKINLLIEKPVLARQLGDRGREIVKERFSPEVHLQRLITSFCEAIDSYPESR